MADESANRRLKIEAHDASRVEWSMYIPLPRDREISEAEVSFRLEFPENVYVPHDGWEQLQILARLSSPDEESAAPEPDRKSTRLNSSHRCNSYAVFCLKKKITPRHKLD